MKILPLKAIIYFGLLFFAVKIIAFPISNFDYTIPENGVSPAVNAIGGINLTNSEFTSTSYYNPALLAFRKKSTISASFRLFEEDELKLNNNNLPDENSLLWNDATLSYVGIEAENVAFNYVSLARIHYENTSLETGYNYLSYHLDCYRISYAGASDKIAFGLNFNLLNGRVVYLKEDTDNKLESFIDEKAIGYGVDFGAVVKHSTLSYGLYIPNMLTKIYWKGKGNNSLQRRLHMAAQWGSDESFVTSGISRKFDFRSKNYYHLGFQKNISIGFIRDEYYIVPLRIGAYTDQSFFDLKSLKYGFGTGFQYGYFFLDISANTKDSHWQNYYIMSSISISM